MSQEHNQIVHIRINSEDYRKIKILSFASKSLSKSDIIRLALKNYIKQHEDIIQKYEPIYENLEELKWVNVYSGILLEHVLEDIPKKEVFHKKS